MQEYAGAMMQYFHWYMPADGTLWKQLEESASTLAQVGITSIWLPPAYKGAGGEHDVGYGIYDLFDLGEFDQKGSIRTKYGTRREFIEAINAAHGAGLRVYADIVINHKLGGDRLEEFQATPYNPQNRNEPIGELQTIRAWTHFQFPGRKGKYSRLEWHWWHFNAADHNALDEDKDAVYLFEGKDFDQDVDMGKGNYDYLMGNNLDFNNPDVQKEIFYWGEWFLDTTNIDGFRFDAAKHVKISFFVDWFNHMRKYAGRDLFAVGEYWSKNHDALKNFIERTGGNILLFDMHLQQNFVTAGNQGNSYDLRNIFDNSLVKEYPAIAVTLVNSHDIQPLRPLESVVDNWFKPLAYALILLRRDGYPCIFSADYYGAQYKGMGKDGKEHEIWIDSHRWMIDKFLEARRTFKHGDQYDYFNNPDCIGWTRTGNDDHPGGMAVIMSNGDDGYKEMETTSPNTTYIDLTEQINMNVVTNRDGRGEFHCKAGSVSVWIPKKIKS
ncbi:alpha amylase catalytic region [Methanosalsum zhilinae DSM 4017]|uniref:Alpha amylase catalytic region n=1 Tax=Methanosalsum zhilinae (strain DSM 4017 / NBRC 107636 / OCM 62 / WeN5) TaxID=679901 RepID=F7XP95_METZD|nr:alpha-amylase [Methanosalsum zhilinae]AEH60222.1 alpha amylase catalytic region [Methanosalsum zhilinae DSM 4017]